MTDWVQKYHEEKQVEQDQKGGPGSGHHGHSGRPGERGGSAPGKGGGGVPTLEDVRRQSRTERMRLSDESRSKLQELATRFRGEGLSDEDILADPDYQQALARYQAMRQAIQTIQAEDDAARQSANESYRDEVQRSQRQEEQARAERTSLDGFENTLSDRARARAVEALTKVQHSIGGKFQTRRDYIRDRVRTGSRVGRTSEGRALIHPNGSYIRQRDITKTALDYAEWLIRQDQG